MGNKKERKVIIIDQNDKNPWWWSLNKGFGASFLCISLFALLVRLAVSLHPYSGAGNPPKFGDFEAQRHWMEITTNLPVKEWYHNSTANDLSYWGLDYPPLTAYQSYVHGIFLKSVLPESVSLFTSRGHESYFGKLLMRWTVLSSDILVFLPAVFYFVLSYSASRSRRHQSDVAWLVAMILLNPCLIAIDHGHFQFNSISLGLTIGAVAAVISSRELVACTLFTLALSHKQMSAYFAPAFFSHLLGRCLRRRNPFLEVSKLALVVIGTFAVVWWPYLHSKEAFLEVLARLAPFERGIYEDYVANFWCTTSILIKWKKLFDNQSLRLISLVATVSTCLPSMVQQNSLRDSDIGSERCRSLHRDDFERLGYKKDAFLSKHKESYSFSRVRSGRDLEQLSLRDSDIDSEKSSAPSKIVVLKPGPDSFSANDESWVTSSSSMDDRDCIEDLLEEVRERLRYEMQGNALNKGSMVRGGGIETPFKEKPAYERQTYQPVAKCVKENTNGDLDRKLFRSESARFYKNESLMSELAPSSPEYMSKDTKKFLSERLRNILDREKHPNHHLTSGGSPREPLFDDARVRLEKARDILNAEHGKHSWCDGNYDADTRARSFRYELKDDGNTQEQPSPRNLIRSLSAPVSGMSFGKLLLEDRYVSPGAHIKRKHEAFDKFSFDIKDQRKERFNLREKVSSLKHSLSLRRMLFSKKLESMDLSESNEFNSTKDIMNGPSVISSFNDRNDNSTELPPSPASICSSYQEEFWKPIDHTSPASISDVTSVEDHGVGNVFKDISSNLTELRKQLNQLDYEGSEISQITTVTGDPSESEMIELESEAEVYIKNLLVASGLYDGSWVKSFSRWDPYVKPMGNWVFEKVEESYQKPTNEYEAASYNDSSLEHKLFFDLLNEALTIVLGPPRILSKFKRKITEVVMLPHPLGRKLLEQVWEMVCEFLYPSSYTSCYSFDDLVAHDLNVMPWSSHLDEEMCDMGKELEYQIIGDLVEELLMDMQF